MTFAPHTGYPFWNYNFNSCLLRLWFSSLEKAAEEKKRKSIKKSITSNPSVLFNLTFYKWLDKSDIVCESDMFPAYWKGDCQQLNWRDNDNDNEEMFLFWSFGAGNANRHFGGQGVI